MADQQDKPKIALASPESPTRFHNYGSIISDPRVNWLGQLPFPYYPADLDGVDAVIVSDEWGHESRSCIAACKLRDIPTFHILDGVIRWKNLFENPRSSVAANGSPFLRPLISDLTFVMGDFQAAVLRWLGNSQICVSGLPRFANYEPKNCTYGESKQPLLLLASSNRPWYTESQREFFIPEFQRLLRTLKKDCNALGVPLHCRLSSMVEWEDVEPSWLGPHPPFHEQLRQCTALITTPSTIAVEGMLLGIPTLVFDPWADPILVPSPWTADDPNVVSTLLPSLLAPSRERASLQDLICRYTVRDSRQSAELIVNIIAREVAIRGARVSGSSDLNSEPHGPQEAPHLQSRRDWDLDTPHVLGLVQTIPQLAAMLHEQQVTTQMIRRFSDTIQATNTPMVRVIGHRIKAFVSKRMRNGKQPS